MNLKVIIGQECRLGAGIKLQENGFDCVILEAEKDLADWQVILKIKENIFSGLSPHPLSDNLHSALKQAAYGIESPGKK